MNTTKTECLISQLEPDSFEHGMTELLSASILQWIATCENSGVWVRIQVAGRTFISETPSLHMQRYTHLAYLFQLYGTSLMSRDGRIADCTLSHPGIEHSFSSLLLFHIHFCLWLPAVLKLLSKILNTFFHLSSFYYYKLQV